MSTNNGHSVKRVIYAIGVNHDKTIRKEKNTLGKHSVEFRKKPLALAEKIGISGAAKELGFNDSQIYGWRSKARAKQVAP